jgi:hypothetical protein
MADHEIEEGNRNATLELARNRRESQHHTNRLLRPISTSSRSLSPVSIAPGRDNYLPRGEVEDLVQSSMASGYKPVFLNGPYAAPKEQPQLQEQESLGVESLINRYVGRVRGYG